MFQEINNIFKEKHIQSNNVHPDLMERYLKLKMSFVEYISPNEVNLETGRLIKLLCQHSYGLKRDEILKEFYTDFNTSSLNRQDSLRIRLEKIIQRARIQFKKYNLTIYYCKMNKKYYLQSI